VPGCLVPSGMVSGVCCVVVSPGIVSRVVWGYVMPSDSQVADGLRPILRQIVGRCHVADSLDSVIDYAKSRLAAGAWESMSEQDRFVFRVTCEAIHKRNRAMYRDVMGGTR
jgi:hypothetical protein